ncbi:MAG: hypothetical protein R2798_09440 [Chitinophagales bacterium]|nr:hypothetical protein [Bacteroidota bacterium]MCB9044449.1 hypothetical protein [Chitinophagales bacterium]
MKKHLNLANKLTAEEMIEVCNHLQKTADLLGKFSVSLSDEERFSVRNVSKGREDYVREVLRVTQEFSDELPRSVDIAEFGELLAIFDDWRKLILIAEKIAEKTDDTNIVLGIELMRYADTCYPILQNRRNDNANLDRAMQRLDDYNKRFGGPSKPFNKPPDLGERPLVDEGLSYKKRSCLFRTTPFLL